MALRALQDFGEMASGGKQQGESPLNTLLRGGARTATTLGASALGTGGDIANLGLGVGNYLSGGAIPTYGQVQEKLPVSLPTSGQIEQFVGEQTGGYTQPQSAREEMLNNIVGIAGTFFMPGKAAKALGKVLPAGAAAKTAKALYPLASGKEVSAIKSLGIAAAGEAGAQGVGALGGGPLAQTAARLGMMTAAGIPGVRQELETTMENSYDAARKAVTAEAGEMSQAGKDLVDVSKVTSGFNKLRESVENSAIPDKEIVMGVLDDATKELTAAAAGKGGHAFVNDILNLKQNLNKWLKLGFSPKVPGEKYLPGSARDEVVKALDLVKDPLEKFGKVNKEFGTNFAQAEELFKGFNDLSKTTQFLEKNFGLKGTLSSSLGKIAFFGGPYYTHGVPGALAAAGSVYAGKEMMKLRDLLHNILYARKEYTAAMAGALKNSTPTFAKHAMNFDKAAKKYEKKHKGAGLEVLIPMDDSGELVE